MTALRPPVAGSPVTASAVVDSAVGPLLVSADDRGLTDIRLLRDQTPPTAVPDHPVLHAAAEQLAAYFAGRRTTFDLPLAPVGTPFQLRVWQALCDIAYGETESYGSLARRIGSPTAARAVGAANGQNPISIVVPCHRVVGSNGRLVGYGGGLDNKRILLELETRVRLNRDFGAAGAELPA